MKKKFILFVVLVLMLSCCSFSVSAASGPTVEKVTRISEGALMIEFSEDIIIEGRNPFVGVRVLDANGSLLYVDGAPKQFYNFDFSVVDGRTILLTTEDGYGRKMMSKTGEFAFYRDCTVMFCIEELFPEGVNARGDGTVYNIKSRETGLRLASHYGGSNALDGCYFAIEEDYTYIGTDNSDIDNMDDPNAEKPADDTQANTDNNTFITDELSGDKVSVIHQGGNEKITWIALGVGAVDFVGILAVLAVILLKNKSKRRGEEK